MSMFARKQRQRCNENVLEHPYPDIQFARLEFIPRMCSNHLFAGSSFKTRW